ncbi:MAG: type II secretion system F family protein [Candidatus Portnoybacteria bacterium]|nr:type II secretion system F family protein [Candidatus Portnoybacteria bacterium]
MSRLDIHSIIAKVKGVSLKEKIIFTRNLALIIRAGMSLPQGLETLSIQTSSPMLKMIIGQIKEAVIKGKDFSGALALYQNIFTNFYISMVKTGEASGNLEKVLENLAVSMEKERSLRSKIVGALIYPSVIVVLMVVVVIIMMVFIIPRLTQVFRDFNAKLPLMTRVIIAISEFLSAHFFLLVAFLIGVPLALWYFFFRVPKGRVAFSWLTLHIPVFNALVKKVNTARIARTLQTLISSGVPIVKSLEITSEVLQNHYYRAMLSKAQDEVVKGKLLSDIFKEYPNLYPAVGTQLIAVGEETGALDQILKDTADFYEEEVDEATKNLSSLVEPVLMIIIGVGVGILALSILQPIYSISSSIHI